MRSGADRFCDANLGQHKGLAVALWATGSTVDKRYRNLRTIRPASSRPAVEAGETA